MTCCTGKARIYYAEPLGFELRYKLSGGSWNTVTANEALFSTCEPEPTEPQPGIYYYVTASALRWDGEVVQYQSSIPYLAPFSLSVNHVYQMGWWNGEHPYIGEIIITKDGVDSQLISLFHTFWSNLGTLRIDGEPDPETYKFKVIGENTGTEYVNIGGLEECPEVNNLGCVMGEENYYDTLLPDQAPDGNIESSCFVKIPVPGTECFHVVLETKYKNLAPKTPTPPQTRSQLYLCGLPGCPAEYRIECCPTGECDPPKCPPDTDCELDCGSFVCCYKNGKVIKAVRK